MDIKFNSKEIKKKAIKHFSVFLWLFVFFMMAIEAMVIRESIDIFLNLQRVSDKLQGQNLRINFEFYEKLEERLSQSSSYRPEPFIYVSPFGTETVDAPAELIRQAQEEEARLAAEEAARQAEQEAQQQAEQEAQQQAEQNQGSTGTDSSQTSESETQPEGEASTQTNQADNGA